MSSITSIDKKVLKGQLYKIKETQTVTITEKDENVNQRVRIHFKISDKKNFALYGEEWKSQYAPDSNIKKPDILAIYFDDKKNISEKVQAYRLDLKKDVGGDEGITHLIEQWNDGYKHCNAITQYYHNVKIKFGVICDNFDRERIEKSLSDKRRELQEISSHKEKLMSYKLGQIEQKNTKMIKILSDFLDNIFMLEQNEEYCKFKVYMTVYDEECDIHEFDISLPE